jgi:hypothetical protein
MIETAIYNNARPTTSLSLPTEMNESPFLSSDSEAQPAVASLPPHETGALFVNAYLSYIHPGFPFLSKKKVWDLHRNRKIIEDAAIDEERPNYIILLLVYAIGSRCLQLVGAPATTSIEPESYYSTATSRISDQTDVPSIQNIQIVLLAAIYALRSPSSKFKTACSTTSLYSRILYHAIT